MVVHATTSACSGARPLGGDPADIGVRDGLVTGLGPGAAAEAGRDAQVLDAAGLIALPGLVDLPTAKTAFLRSRTRLRRSPQTIKGYRIYIGRYIANGVTTTALAVLPFGVDPRQAMRDLAPQ